MDNKKHTQRVLINGKPLFPVRYYGGKDLKGQPRNVIIVRVEREKMYSRDVHAVVEKPVIYLRGKDPKSSVGFVMGKELSESIADALGEWDAAKWTDREVCIYPHDTPVGIAVMARVAKNGVGTLPAGIEEEADAGQFQPEEHAASGKSTLDRIIDVLTFHEVPELEQVYKKLLTAAKGDAQAALEAAEKRYGKVPAPKEA